MHSQYSSSTYKNDIALLKLAKPLQFKSDNKIAPVCLPSPGETHSEILAIVTGWGTTSYGNKIKILNRYR